MNMVKTITIAILLSMVFISCEVTDVEITDRIQMFEDDLNSTNRNGIWNNFLAPYTSVYGTIDETTYWDTEAPYWGQEYIPFEITITSVSGNTATGTISRNGISTPDPVYFDMVSQKDGFTTTWYIDNVNINGGNYEIQSIGY